MCSLGVKTQEEYMQMSLYKIYIEYNTYHYYLYQLPQWLQST